MRMGLVLGGLALALAACSSGGAGGGSNGGNGSGTTGGGCPTALCGSTCCTSSQTCVKDSSNNTFCAENCTDSSQCPSASPCCEPLGNTCVNVSDCPSVCTAVATSGSQACRCTTGSQCTTNCCAPATDSNNNLVGFSICQADLGGLYECCNSTPCFGATDCCVVDGLGNRYCAEPCSSSSTCGAGQCDTDDFSHTICSGNMACGN